MDVTDLEFVMRAARHAGDENFPDARRTQRPHWVAASVPIVEIPDHTYTLGVWRPDGEAGSGDAVDDPHLGTQFFKDPVLIAFAEQVQVRLAESRQKRVGIAAAGNLPGRPGDHDIVSVNIAGLARDAFEDVRPGQAFELDGRFVFFVNRLQLNFRGARHEGSPHQPGALA